MLDPSVFSRYKSVEDFTRERDEFEARKRAAALQEQLSGLQVQGLQKQLSTPEALSNEQILAKAVQAGGIGGLSPQEQAQLQAFDIMQRTKQSQNPYTGEILTNRSVFDMLPGQVAQMSPRDVMNMPTRAPTQQPIPYPMPTGGEQIPTGGNLGVSTQQPPMVATPAAMPTAPITVNPEQYGVNTPFGAERLKEKAAEEAIKLQGQTAQANLEAQKKQQDNQKIYNTFSIGMQNVESAMQNAETNPVAGALPPLTPEAQTAQGSVGLMAPILKSMFREAGEGTFTDKDQELLLEMIPTRSDYPAARKAKINMINQIVRSKLGIDAAAQPVPYTDYF